MRTLISLLAALILLPCLSYAQGTTKKVISVIGSSTAAGSGASTDAKAWVNIVQQHYLDLGILKENIHNLARSGYHTSQGMPTGFMPPGIQAHPVPDSNVTAALRFNPDVVIVAYGGNDLVDFGYGMTDMMSNLRTIYDTVVNRGKICYITSTQPRDAVGAAGRQRLRDGKDSIMAEFPLHSVDFWTPVADLNADNYEGINPILAVPGDGIHLNDSGHSVLAKAFLALDIFGSGPLAITLLSFMATLNGQTGFLSWTTTDASGLNYFIVQRSADGAAFEDLGQVNAVDKGQQTDYSWTDPTPLAGKNFYRLKIVGDEKAIYSRVVGLLLPGNGLNISKLYLSKGGSELQAEISLPHDQQLTVTIANILGVLVRQQTVIGLAPSQKIPISITGLAAGQYFFKVTAANGDHVTRAFLSF